MWSDPEDIDEWGVSPRGAGYLFGCEVVSQVCVHFDGTTKLDPKPRLTEVQHSSIGPIISILFAELTNW